MIYKLHKPESSFTAAHGYNIVYQFKEGAIGLSPFVEDVRKSKRSESLLSSFSLFTILLTLLMQIAFQVVLS